MEINAYFIELEHQIWRSYPPFPKKLNPAHEVLWLLTFIYLMDPGGGLYDCRFFLTIRGVHPWEISRASVNLQPTQYSSGLMEQHNISFRYFQRKLSVSRLIAVPSTDTGLTLTKKKTKEKNCIWLINCFVISFQRKTYWINTIWQEYLPDIILQIPNPHFIKSPYVFLYCTARSLQAKPVESKITLNLPCGLWFLTSHLGWLSCRSLLRLYHPSHCWDLLWMPGFHAPPDYAFSHVPRFVIQRLNAWLTASLVRAKPEMQSLYQHSSFTAWKS